MIETSTFSIVAADPEEKSCGIAVASKFFAVGRFTSKECVDFAGGIIGLTYAVQGNSLTGKQVIENFEDHSGFQS